jgi:hypothetical protein
MEVRMKRIVLALVLFLAVGAIYAMAQDPAGILPTKPFDISQVEVILLTGIGGIGVKGLTEIIKRFLKVDGLKAVLVSAGVSIIGVGYYFFAMKYSFNIGYFVLYAALVFLAANGLYKSGRPEA